MSKQLFGQGQEIRNPSRGRLTLGKPHLEKRTPAVQEVSGRAGTLAKSPALVLSSYPPVPSHIAASLLIILVASGRVMLAVQLNEGHFV